MICSGPGVQEPETISKKPITARIFCYYYLLYLVCTTSQGIQLHLHLKVKIQNSREMEVLLLLWKQWRSQGGKTQQRCEEIKLGPSGGTDIPTATSVLPCFHACQQHCKISKPQKLQIYTCGFLPPAQEREVGVQKQVGVVSQLKNDMPQEAFYR